MGRMNINNVKLLTCKLGTFGPGQTLSLTKLQFESIRIQILDFLFLYTIHKN